MQPEAFFRALSDATRLRSLMLMQSEGELCVCELTAALDLSQPKISRHLGQLRDLGVTRVRREGTWVFYRISDDLPAWAARVLEETFKGTEGSTRFREDRQRLTGMSGRPPRACCQ